MSSSVRWQCALLPIFIFLCWILAIRHLSSEWIYNEQYQFGWVVPALALYLGRIRAESVPLPGTGWKNGPVKIGLAAITLVEVLLLPIAEANADWRLLGAILTGSASAATLLACVLMGGTRWALHFAFPALFLFTAVPWPRELETDVMHWLMQHNALLAAELLHWSGISAAIEGNLIQLNAATVGIDEACSGIRSLQGTLMTSLFVGEIFELGPVKRLLLLLAGIVWAFITNSCRTFFLCVMTEHGGEAAHDRWHDGAGHWALGACVIGVVLLGWAFSRTPGGRRKARKEEAMVSTGSEWIERLRGQSVTALLGVILLFVAWSGTKTWFRMQEAAVEHLASWSFQQPTKAPSFEVVTQPSGVRTSLRYTAESGGRWRDAEGKLWLAQFFRWEPGLNDVLGSLNHDPRVCLGSSGKELVRTLPSVTFRKDDVILPFDAYWFRDRGKDVFVFNCVVEDVQWNGAQDGEDTRLGLSKRIEAVRLGRRNLGRRRLEVAVWEARDPDAATAAFVELLHKQVVLERDPGKKTG